MALFCSCFLCSGETQSGSKFSLQNLLRYLKVDLGQTSVFKTPAKMNKPEVLVSLCSDCEIIFKKFTKHHEDLEVCKMRVESSLEDILTKLESNGAVTADFGAESGVVDELRQKVLMASKSRKNGFPRGVLQKWDGAPIETSMYDQIDETKADLKVEEEEGLDGFLELVLEVDSEGNNQPALDSNPEIREFLEPSRVADGLRQKVIIEQKSRKNESQMALQIWNGVPVEPEPLICDQADTMIDVKIEQEKNASMDDFLEPICELDSEVDTKPALDSTLHVSVLPGEGYPQGNEPVVKTKLVQELQRQHEVQDTYTCRFCKLDFPLLISLNWHLLQNHKEDLSPSEIKAISIYKCNYCSKQFRSKRKLFSHLQIHTTEDEYFRFKCSKCNKTFKRKGSVVAHEKTHKEGSFKTPDWIIVSDSGKEDIEKPKINVKKRKT